MTAPSFQLLRRLLQARRSPLAGLGPVWDVRPDTVYKRLYSGLPVPVAFLDRTIAHLKLSETEAEELRSLVLKDYQR